jgi:formylglycine-generating enzyme required for sulfatase activity
MTLPTFVLSLHPLGDDRFSVRLERRGVDGAVSLLAPTSGAPPVVLELPAGWQHTCAQARRTPAAPPPAFGDLAFELGARLEHATGAALVLDLPARIVLCAGGDAAAVPWEVLATEVQAQGAGGAPNPKHVPTAPFLRGQWQLVRRPPGVLRNAVPRDADRRALLVVGSLRAPQSAVEPLQELARIVTAMRRAGFVVTIAAGRTLTSLAAPQGLDINEWLDEPARVPQLLRDGRFTLFHYVGHAVDPQDDLDAAGAEDLRLEIHGKERFLTAADLAPALRAGQVRCAVFSACDVREAFATQLLADAPPQGEAPSAAPTALEHILSMGARVLIAVCADWSEGFYESLRDQPAVAVAVTAAATRLRGNDRGRRHAWLPQHWSATDVDLTFADDERVLIERVCRRMLVQLDAFEGRFRRRLEPARLADVYVDLFVDPRRDEEKARAAGETLDPRDVLPADAKFEDLLRLTHTRAFLLGGAPGAGKSTTLRVCARKLADNPLRACVPLFVALVDWLPKKQGDGASLYPHLLDYLATQHLNTGQDEVATLRAALRARGDAGELAFFLDGLDELSTAARAFLDAELSKLRADFDRCRFVVSSRRYEHSTRLAGFVPFDILPLQPKDAAKLLANVLRTNPRTQAEAERVAHEDWLPEFQHGPRTWLDLGKVPLFVTLIGELLIHGRKPGDSRVAFFREVFDHLCLDRHHGADVDPQKHGAGPRPLIAEATGAKCDPKRQRARVDAALDVLAFVAWKMTEASQLTATRNELVAWIEGGGEDVTSKLAVADVATEEVVSTDPGAFLDAVARLTLILAPDVSTANVGVNANAPSWRFWHRSLQEALTARRLSAGLRNPSDAALVVDRMRIEPTAAETEAARIGLLAKWSDQDALVNDFNEVYTRATPAELNRLWAHFDPANGRFRSTITDELATIACNDTAKRTLLDFWIEPAALVLAVAVEAAAPASSHIHAMSDAFLDALLRRDQGLGRSVVAVLDRCPAAMFARAIAATSRNDDDVAKANDGMALHKGLTIRLSERLSLYRGAASSTIEPERLADALALRIKSSDDAGELFLIDEALAALAARCDVAAAQMALKGRFGRPSAELYRDWFVRLAGGSFRRGSEQGEARERPVREVVVSPFAIGRTAVTVAMYREFFAEHRMEVGEDLVRLKKWQGKVKGDAEDEDEPVDAFPVTYVSWWAAQMFCRWLSWHRADLPKFGDWTPSLPTEAEREFAARGGKTTAYSFGDDPALLDRYGWFRKDAQAAVRPHAVARKQPNPFGLFDMHGGVWEWCLDAYGPYAPGRDPLVDPLAGGASASARVLRGGSFDDRPDLCRSAYRDWNHPAVANWDDGFRVVLAARPQLGSAIDDRS